MVSMAASCQHNFVVGMSRSSFFAPDPDPSHLILSICRYQVPIRYLFS